MGEPFYRPGEGEGRPPQSPTQFGPAKPAGPDPVSPLPLPEGSEVDRHAQLFAYDSSSEQFKPVEWSSGALKVDLMLSGVTVDIDWTDQYFTVIQTLITRAPNGLISVISETDGVRTKNTIFNRDIKGRVASIQEVMV